MSGPVRILKDGYWERTSVVTGPDGQLRVRKESKESATPGPWAHEALRNEIAYMRALPESLRACFPPLLDSWDDEDRGLGYEIPYEHGRDDAAALLRAGQLGQAQAVELQEQLAEFVVRGLHRSVPLASSGFATHLESVIADSLQALGGDPRFQPLLSDPAVTINGREVPGMETSLATLREGDLLPALDAAPAVLLHGDLILENILWPPLLLIDPVSVAGLTSGPPLFDLVKYESYASGELFAIREELAEAGPDGDGFVFRIDRTRAELAPFQGVDLQSVFRSAFEGEHGPVSGPLYALLDAYFSLVMARNTSGTHQWARVIKGTQRLADALNGKTKSDSPISK